MSVLEPSADKGDLAEAILRNNPKVNLDVIEISPSLREILELKEFNLVGNNFLEYNSKKYDRIIMNPPFVKYAFSLLKSEGILVSIMERGAFFVMAKKKLILEIG